jgi:hypothetical protein
MRATLIALTAVAVTMSAPLGAATQISTPPSGVSTPPVTTATPAKKPRKTPTQYLDEAKRALAAVPSGPRQGEVHDGVAHLRKAFDEMASAYETGQPAPHGPKDLPPPTPIEWQNQFYAIETDLVLLIGGGTTLSSDATAGAVTSGSPPKSGAAAVAPAGTTQETSQLVADQGLKPLPEGLAGVDAALRAALERFRTQLELFYDATTTHDYEAHPGQS